MDSPFEQVLLDLNGIASNVSTLIGPVTQLDTAVTDITNVLQDLDNLFTDFNDVCIVVADLQVVALALNAIPVVGEVADALNAVAGVLDEVNADIKPIKVVVDDIDGVLVKVDGGLNSLKKIMVEVATDIPDATKTIAILNALLEIASPLAQILSGSEASTRLTTVINQYNNIKNEVATDVKPIVSSLEDITSVVAKFVAEIEQITGDLKSHIGNAVDSVTQAKGTITPVHDAMTVIHDILKPVLWLLHAIEYVFKHTVEPLIHDALEKTGLEKLIDGLEAKLTKSLGIGAIIKDIETTLGGNKIAAYGAVFDLFDDASALSVTATNWVDLLKVLGEYQQAGSSQKPKLAAEAVNDLVQALIGGTVDDSKITFGNSLGPPPTASSSGSSSSASSSSVTIPSGFNSSAAAVTSAKANLGKIKQIALTVSGDASS